MHRLRLTLLVAAIGAAAVGCPNCAPGQVGEGVARLTVRNIGAMATLVSDDATCGFASDKAVATTTGDVGGLGSLTLTVTDCAIDAGKNTVVSTDCDGVKTQASGKVTISATRTVAGTLTGDATNPIVPSSADAVTITITKATFTNFEVSKDGSDNKLKMESGSITGKLNPRLAVSATNGACAIATPNTKFTDLSYSADTKVFVTTKDNQFEADVAASKIAADNGKGTGGENDISGTMTVFGSDVDVKGADGKLDPDYDAAKFTASYACTDDLASPESFTCLDPTPLLADGAARLTIKMIGTIAGIVDANSDCGFSSTAVQGAAVPDGTVGGLGSITFETTACTIAFADLATLGADCSNVSTQVKGSITVTGTKTLTGRLTGDAATPIVPDSDSPAVFNFSAITVDNFSVGSTANANALLAKTGTLSGSVTPRTTLDTTNGSCAIATPNAFFENVAWSTADLLVTSDSGNFGLPVDSSALSAVNGNVAESTNTLSGTVTVGGAALSVPSDNLGLDPAFDQAAFDAAWQCAPNIASPPVFACAFVQPIAIGAAALTMRTFGNVASLVNADTSCGFGSVAVGGTPTFTGGNIGDDHVTATFTLPAEGCTIDIAQATVISTDCNADTTSFSGTVVVHGTKVVTGFRTGDPTEPVIPTSTDPAVFHLTMDLAHTTVTTTASTSSLTVHTGTLAGDMQPRVALDTTTGACSVATPNIAFSNVVWSNSGDVTLVSDGKSFNMALASSDLTATAGTIDASSNALGGTINVDGTDVTVGGALDPAFVQADFDATYQCLPNTVFTVNADACSFRTVLGNAAARLLVKGVGVGASVLKGNTVCGFSSAGVVGTAVNTGNAGGPGSVLFTAGTDCLSGFAQDTTLATDCLGTTTHAAGAFTTSAATLDVQGLLTGNVASPVVPLAPGAAAIDLTGVSFTGFTYFDQLAGGEVPVQATLTGVVDALVNPFNGQSIAATAQIGGTPAFAVSTPVAKFTALGTTNATMTIVTDNKTFNITIDSADLNAFAGGFDTTNNGAPNTISGTIAVDGVDVTIQPPDLVTGFVQATFDSTYSCNPDLVAPLAP